MLKKKTKGAKPIADINVVPYIDVMLVLLVIFMITAPMLTQGVSVDLPKTAAQAIESPDREPIIVSVNQQGDYFLNISEEPETPITTQALSLRIAAELELAKQTKQNLPVLVKGDQGASYGKVVLVMAVLKQAGVEQLGLVTDSAEEARPQ